MNKEPQFETFRIESICRFPGDKADRIIIGMRYEKPGVTTNRLIAIYNDLQEYCSRSRRRYGSDHWRGARIIIEIRCGQNYVEYDCTEDVRRLVSEVDAVRSNPELSADDKRRHFVTRISDYRDYVAWRDRHYPWRDDFLYFGGRSAAYGPDCHFSGIKLRLRQRRLPERHGRSLARH